MKILIFAALYAIGINLILWRSGLRQNKRPAVGVLKRELKRLLIVGATGGTGRELVSQALDRGYEVTALVRDPAKLKVEHPNLFVKQGDVVDSGTIDLAMKGNDAVLSALGHKRFFVPTRILSSGTKNIIRSMEENHQQFSFWHKTFILNDLA